MTAAATLKGRMREARKLGPDSFKKTRDARLLEVSQHEGVSKYQLQKIIRAKKGK